MAHGGVPVNATVEHEIEQEMEAVERAQAAVRQARMQLDGGVDEDVVRDLRSRSEALHRRAQRLEDENPELACDAMSCASAGLDTADDPADADPPDWRKRTHEKVRRAVDQAKRDGDPAPVYDAASALAELSAAEYANVKTELRDALGRKLRVRELDAVVKEARRAKRRAIDANDDRPRIAVGDRPLRELSDDSLEALVDANRPPCLFVRGGAVTRVRYDEAGRPVIEALGETHVRGEMTRAANYVRGTQSGEVHVMPPDAVAADLIVRGDWRFPPLATVIETPAVRPDGSILTEPGYDAATRLLLAPSATAQVPPVASEPDAAALAAARDLIGADLLADFPFADEASRANAFAFLLTPIMRPAISGTVPLALIDAPKAGNGKGLLANLAALIATGRMAAMTPAPVREEEWAKAILALLAEGATMIVLDEAHELGSVNLAAALTAETFSGRILGRSETATVPQRATWAACGNNMRTRGDIARRCYPIRLDAKVARPWTRHDFRHPDLLGWAAAHRGELLAALLTLARGWYAAGQPVADVPPLGGFDAWARTVGGVLAHAGVEGFLRNLPGFYEQADDEASEWRLFLEAWSRRFGDEPVLVGELATALRAEHGVELRDALPGDLAAAADAGPGSFRTKLGKALSKREGTRYGDHEHHLVRAEIDSRGGRPRWRVHAAGLQGSQGLVQSALKEVSLGGRGANRKSRENGAQAPLQTLQPCEPEAAA